MILTKIATIAMKKRNRKMWKKTHQMMIIRTCKCGLWNSILVLQIHARPQNPFGQSFLINTQQAS